MADLWMVHKEMAREDETSRDVPKGVLPALFNGMPDIRKMGTGGVLT